MIIECSILICSAASNNMELSKKKDIRTNLCRQKYLWANKKSWCQKKWWFVCVLRLGLPYCASNFAKNRQMQISFDSLTIYNIYIYISIMEHESWFYLCLRPPLCILISHIYVFYWSLCNSIWNVRIECRWNLLFARTKKRRIIILFSIFLLSC